MKSIPEALNEPINGTDHYPYYLLIVLMIFFSIGLGLTNAHFILLAFLLVPASCVLSELIYDVKTTGKNIIKSFCGNSHYPRILSVILWSVIAYGISFIHIELAIYTAIASPFIRVIFEIMYIIKEKCKS